MDEPLRSLPLFPLHVTLFPRGELALHIFEPRYREMVRTCLDGDRRFGVVLIASGREVGAPAVPHLVGTIALLTQINPLPDGRLHVLVRGERRCRIEHVALNEAGYLVGSVRLLPEVLDDEPDRLASLVDEARSALSDAAAHRQGREALTHDLLLSLDDPVQLTALLADAVPREHARKQRILENDPISRRLRLMLSLVQRELRLLRLLARASEAPLWRDILSAN